MLDLYGRPVYVNTYYVWRRNDGYVSATTFMPEDYTDSNGREWTSELLLKTADWLEARAVIESAR